MRTIHCPTVSCVSGGGGGVNATESTVKGAKAGEAQSWHCANMGGGPSLALTAYQSGGTTSHWLLSCLYYAKTCILEGAWFGVESQKEDRFCREQLAVLGDMQRCICMHVFMLEG